MVYAMGLAWHGLCWDAVVVVVWGGVVEDGPGVVEVLGAAYAYRLAYWPANGVGRAPQDACTVLSYRDTIVVHAVERPRC